MQSEMGPGAGHTQRTNICNVRIFLAPRNISCIHFFYFSCLHLAKVWSDKINILTIDIFLTFRVVCLCSNEISKTSTGTFILACITFDLYHDTRKKTMISPSLNHYHNSLNISFGVWMSPVVYRQEGTGVHPQQINPNNPLSQTSVGFNHDKSASLPYLHSSHSKGHFQHVWVE